MIHVPEFRRSPSSNPDSGRVQTKPYWNLSRNLLVPFEDENVSGFLCELDDIRDSVGEGVFEKRTGISSANVYSWNNKNKNREIRLESLANITRAFSIPPERLKLPEETILSVHIFRVEEQMVFCRWARDASSAPKSVLADESLPKEMQGTLILEYHADSHVTEEMASQLPPPVEAGVTSRFGFSTLPYHKGPEPTLLKNCFANTPHREQFRSPDYRSPFVVRLKLIGTYKWSSTNGPIEEVGFLVLDAFPVTELSTR